MTIHPQVLYGHMNDNEVYSLYVTDYTINKDGNPIQADWCPPALSDQVLKIEMWDAAASLGPTMLQGEYYSINNARMRVSQGGLVEGKVVERKVYVAKEDNPHLQALLS